MFGENARVDCVVVLEPASVNALDRFVYITYPTYLFRIKVTNYLLSAEDFVPREFNSRKFQKLGTDKLESYLISHKFYS